MRIIGGRSKGRRIEVPPGQTLRPTSDRIKEALFNILGPIEDFRFLDLYAGTGNVGIEALSRGAAEAVFVEKIPSLAAALRKNLDRLGFTGRYQILLLEAGKAIEQLAQRGAAFDLIFADPPYREGLVKRTVRSLNACPSILAASGTVILQHAAAEPLKLEGDTAFELEEERRYGDTTLSFLRLKTKRG